MRAFICAGVVAVVLALGPGSALAQQSCEDATVPSGNAEIDQYLETVPGDCGDTPFDGRGSGGGDGRSGSGGGSALAPATEEALEELGPDGQGAAAIAESTAPEVNGDGDDVGVGGAGGGAGPSDGAEAGAAGGTDDDRRGISPDSVIDALSGAAAGGSDSGSLGWAMPTILGSIFLAGGAFFVRRHWFG